MRDELEIRKIELQISRQKVAREELQFRIFEHEHDIKRLQDHIILQDREIVKLTEALNKLKGETK